LVKLHNFSFTFFYVSNVYTLIQNLSKNRDVKDIVNNKFRLCLKRGYNHFPGTNEPVVNEWALNKKCQPVFLFHALYCHCRVRLLRALNLDAKDIGGLVNTFSDLNPKWPQSCGYLFNHEIFKILGVEDFSYFGVSLRLEIKALFHIVS